MSFFNKPSSEALSDQPFSAALNDAEELLKYAAEVGKIVPKEVVDAILTAREDGNTSNKQVRSAFYEAFTQLSSICGDVTAQTIRWCSSPATFRALRRNRVLAVSLTLAIAAVSVITFVTDDLSKRILADMTAANEGAAKLRVELTDVAGEPKELDVKYAQQDPCSFIDQAPSPGDRGIRNIDDVIQLQQLATTIRELLGRALKLNRVIYSIECDPFSMQSCGDPRHDNASIKEPDLTRSLQINPTIINFTAEVVCKIRTYQLVRTFAANVQGEYSAAIGAIASFALPILYAWLGAFAYRLRSFADTIKKKTYHPSFADSARMITAVIAGAIVALFNPSQGIALSPLAIAFLAGYGVELFFRFLDTLINFGSPPSQSGQGGTPGRSA
jgi:hypothetical protein